MKRSLSLILLLALSFLGGCRLFHQHELVHYDELNATCTTEGHGAYDTCADPDCDYITEYDIYPATGHTIVQHEAKAATPEKPGHTTYSTCTNCNYMEGYEELPYSYTLSELLPSFEERLSIVNLSESELSHLMDLYNAAMEFEPVYYFEQKVSVEQAKKYIHLLLYSCPELIQLSEFQKYFHEGDSVENITFDYILSKDEYHAVSDTIARNVLSIVSQTEGMSEFETERFLHDYMIEWCTYNKTTTEHAHSPYGFFVEKKAKCGGYARTFMLLLSAAGIECHCILGTGENENHVWNIVKIEDVYYYVDVTWDDSGNPQSNYCYFNLDLATLLKNKHTISDYYSGSLPECNSMRLYVPYQDGTYITEDQDAYTRLGEMINELIKNDGKSLHIQVATQEQFRSVKNNIDYLIIKYKKEHQKNFRYDWFDSSLNFYFGINISDIE